MAGLAGWLEAGRVQSWLPLLPLLPWLPLLSGRAPRGSLCRDGPPGLPAPGRAGRPHPVRSRAVSRTRRCALSSYALTANPRIHEESGQPRILRRRIQGGPLRPRETRPLRIRSGLGCTPDVLDYCFMRVGHMTMTRRDGTEETRPEQSIA